MKSDISRFGEKLTLRDAELRQSTAKIQLVSNHSDPASSPQIGYKLPFSIDSRPFLTHEGQHSQQMRHHNGEGTGRLFIGEAHPNQLRTQETVPSSTFCRLCPQYGHALIFPRKCYYEAQCPLPLFFCAKTRAGKADDGKRYCAPSMRVTPPKRPVEYPNPKGLLISSAPDSHQHAEIASIESRGSEAVQHALSSPGYPAPKSTQHGEKAVRTSFIEPRISHQKLVHSFLRRLSSTISKRIAYNDPTRENTNFGWRRKQ